MIQLKLNKEKFALTLCSVTLIIVFCLIIINGLKSDVICESESNNFASPQDTDYATAEGCMTLFLMGISPQDGKGLFIPKRSHTFSGEPFPADVFRFFYRSNQIIIPISAETTLKFLYDSVHPIYHFNESGMYKITFSSDWNSITYVEQIDKVPIGPPSIISSKEYSSDYQSSQNSHLSNPQTIEFSTIGFQIGLILFVYIRSRVKKK